MSSRRGVLGPVVLWVIAVAESLRPVDPTEEYDAGEERQLQPDPEWAGERLADHVADVGVLQRRGTGHVDRVAGDAADEEGDRQRWELHAGDASGLEQLRRRK